VTPRIRRKDAGVERFTRLVYTKQGCVYSGNPLKGYCPMASPAVAKNKRKFDPLTFLATIGNGRKTLAVPKEQPIFAQGDGADAVFYIQKGKVKLTVVSKAGRAPAAALRRPGGFCGSWVGAASGRPDVPWSGKRHMTGWHELFTVFTKTAKFCLWHLVALCDGLWNQTVGKSESFHVVIALNS
jgi:hypothetical protein